MLKATRHAVLAQLVQYMIGPDRPALHQEVQKKVYFLQNFMALPTHYTFRGSRDQPYSPEIWDDLIDMCVDQVLVSRKQPNETTHLELGPAGQDAIDAAQDQISHLAAQLRDVAQASPWNNVQDMRNWAHDHARRLQQQGATPQNTPREQAATDNQQPQQGHRLDCEIDAVTHHIDQARSAARQLDQELRNDKHGKPGQQLSTGALARVLEDLESAREAAGRIRAQHSPPAH